MVENETGLKIQTIRSDNGTEFVNKNMKYFLESCHQTSCPYTKSQNGVAERLFRLLGEKARTMLQDAGLGTEYWAEAMNTAIYLKNRSPTKAVLGFEWEWCRFKPPAYFWVHC